VHEWCNDWGTVSGNSSVKMQYRWRRRLPTARRKDPGSFTTAWHWAYF